MTTEEKLKYLEEGYKKNFYLLEKTVALFMIRMQKKHGSLVEGGYETYISLGNPFKEEIDKEARELLG